MSYFGLYAEKTVKTKKIDIWETKPNRTHVYTKFFVRFNSRNMPAMFGPLKLVYLYVTVKVNNEHLGQFAN